MKISHIRQGAFWLMSLLVVACELVYLSTWHTLPQTVLLPQSIATSTTNKTLGEEKPAPAESERTSINATHVQAGAFAIIPARWQFEGITATRTASDSMKWLNSYPHEDMPILTKFNLAHPYVWNVISANQISWMAANGFPMPEDVIAAAGMSDKQLRDAAEFGSMKAKFLYYERIIGEKNTPFPDVKKQVGIASDLIAAHGNLGAEVDRMYKIVRLSDSPYLGYLEASYATWVDDPKAHGEVLAGGLALAYFRGDDRAGNALLALAANGDMSDSEASLAYRIVSQLRDYYPLPADCGPGMATPFPKPSGSGIKGVGINGN
ncbi:hypothetical protein PY254_13730 [Rhodanobacter sp. AS-Z3]|uniref:hypothetical protein n=1 Tax=Rhodanobacter sp. AS-Z3 TaxID=3031330 RepID=UPI002478F5A1|nr:hypothetical protein [Rhodanobacter sp. AS-Z3]WEN14290.1 hypothetical protein PY254_13730 [Rhodanobacter sp. AS-Z3]